MDDGRPMAKGFVYLVAMVDWSTGPVLSWRVSITLDVQFCLDAVEDAMARYGNPAIMNTDQGCQLTSQAFTGLLKAQDVRISVGMVEARGGITSLSSVCGDR